MNRKAKALEFIDSDYDIKITGRNIDVTDSMKDYAIEKIAKIERILNRIIEVNVLMDVQKLEQHVEIIMRAGNLKIASQASSTDMYASIDKAVAKLEAQVRRYKSKVQDHHAKGHAVLNMMVDVIEKPEEEFDFETADSIDSLNGTNGAPRIIKQDSIPLKTLTQDEAVMKMELSGDAFMLFKNEVDLRLKVIYRRADGNYGIIEPDCK